MGPPAAGLATAMGILRWILTISFIGIGLFLALVLGVLLLGVYLVMRMTGALKTVTVRVDGSGRMRPAPSAGAPEPARRPARIETELPLAPAGVQVLHMRAWDEAENRAVDRWYYKDEGGQWIFVQPPGKN